MPRRRRARARAADQSSGVREQAAWALGAIGDSRALPGLLPALKDADSGVRGRPPGRSAPSVSSRAAGARRPLALGPRQSPLALYTAGSTAARPHGPAGFCGTDSAGMLLAVDDHRPAHPADGAVRRRRVRRRQRPPQPAAGLAEDGNALAARLLPVLEDPRELDRYIAASQVGITLSSLILGAYGQATLAPRIAPLFERCRRMQPATAESTAAAVVLVVLTTLAVVLGELVPKSLALQNPTRTALFTVLPMQWSLRAVRLVDRAPERQRRAAAASCCACRSTGHRHVHSPEEIALLIAESRDGGLLEPEEQVRLHRALRLGLRTARQLMVPRARLAAIDASTAVRRGAARRRREPVQPAAGLSGIARQHRRHSAHQGRRHAVRPARAG